LNLAIKKQRALSPNNIIGPHCPPKKEVDGLAMLFFLLTGCADEAVDFVFLTLVSLP
jgi:hypothetical protein